MEPAAGILVRSFHLCGEALAPFGPPPGDHPRAANRRHTLAEAMPPLAHQPARLIGPFHRLRSISGRRLQSLCRIAIQAPIAPCPTVTAGPGHGASIEWAAYRGAAEASQSQPPPMTSRRSIARHVSSVANRPITQFQRCGTRSNRAGAQGGCEHRGSRPEIHPRYREIGYHRKRRVTAMRRGRCGERIGGQATPTFGDAFRHNRNADHRRSVTTLGKGRRSCHAMV